MARSKDGLTFSDTGEVFLRNAAAPGLVRLPRGGILAIFDVAPAEPDGSLLEVSRSDDDGHSWSPPRPVRLAGMDRKLAGPRHGHLIWMPNGSLRLYFAASIRADHRRREEKTGSGALILSATSRNGEQFQCDPEMRVELAGILNVHPIAVRIEKNVHLYVGLIEDLGRRRDEEAGSNHWTSPDGRHFTRAEPVRLRNVRLIGSIIPAEKLFRAYLTGEHGPVSLTTSDGREFESEGSLRLKAGLDPAVVRLKDGSFLMLCCIPPDSPASTQPELAGAAAGKDADEANSKVDAPAMEGEGKSGPGAARQIWEPFPTSSFEIDGETITPDASPGTTADSGIQASSAAGGENAENTATDPNDLFPPKADFAKPVDYLQWLRDHYVNLAVDNSYYAYQPLTVWGAPDPNQAIWDGLEKVMLNSSDYKGPPGPWDPAEHPDWANGLEAGAGLLDYFRQATWHADYATVPFWGPDKPDGPLLEILLPSLRAHRQLTRATLSAAWEAKNGQVSPERMLSSLDTTLRGAGHMMNGFSIIERLVGVAERNLIEQTARQALVHNVFSTPEQLAAAYTTLAQLDRDNADPADWIRGEYAAQMDTAQRLFTPGPDGQPRVDPQGLEWFSKCVSGADFAAFQQLGPEDAKKIVEHIDSFFRKAIDQVRAGDYNVDALAMQYAETDPFAKQMLPSLSRAFELRRRGQSSTCATQLAYALHLFKAQTGRWPASLDELPAEFAPLRTDPYNGGSFAYHVTAGGPMIYSTSTNGRDDGGIHSSHWGDRDDGGSDDFVFWPPQ